MVPFSTATKNADADNIDVSEGGLGLADAIISNASKVAESKENEGTPYAINASITMVGGVGALEVRDLLALIAWTRDFLLRLEEDGPRKILKDTETHAECDTLLEELRDEYQRRARLQLRNWLGKTSWQREMEVIENSEGRLVTADPEDMVFAIKTQLSVAKEYLSACGCVEVMVDILSEIKVVQERMESALDSEWEAMGVERLCSVVNDCVALSEHHMNLFNDTMFTRDVLPTYELKRARDDVSLGYLALALQATNLVASSVMDDLRKPVLLKVFSSRWQSDSGGDVVSVCTATLKDYFLDLRSWLPMNFFCRVVRNCMKLVLEGYLEGAFSQPPGTFFRDTKAVSEILLRDRLNLVEFFGVQYLKEVSLGGKDVKERNDIEDEFEILRAMSRIVSASNAEDVIDEIHILLRELGYPVGQAATLYLVRIRPCRGRRIQNWKDTVQGLGGADKSDIIQPRLECDLSGVLLREPNKFEQISEVFYLRAEINALTSSARRRVSNYKERRNETMNKGMAQPQTNDDDALEPSTLHEVNKSTDPTMMPSLQGKSIKALVDADIKQHLTLPPQGKLVKASMEADAKQQIPVAPSPTEWMPPPWLDLDQDEGHTSPDSNAELKKEKGYRFSDITRGLVAKGKARDGREEADTYKLGDLSRGIVDVTRGLVAKGKARDGRDDADTCKLGDLSRGVASKMESKKSARQHT